MNIGRVQTPTLAMIVERGAAISGFVKEKYFNVKLNDVGLLDSDKIKTLSEAEKIKSECDGNTAIVRSVKREKKSINPPRLFDLTTLQREANRLYGFTAQQTLDYAQSLYESRILSYPRSDSQYLTDDMGDSTLEIIGYVREKMPCFAALDFTPDVSKILNSSKVTDHTGIIPTAEIKTAKLDELPDGERKIFELVANKLLCATAEKHEYEAVSATIQCGGYSFVAKSKNFITNGWKGIEKLLKCKVDDDSDDSDDCENSLELCENQELIADCKISENWTKPPLSYTEDTLLKSMSKAGTDDVTEDVERTGLGTPATRASIIEKLIKSGFVKRDKKSLVATESGKELISLMPDNIKSAAMTAEWENALSLIAKGEFSAEYFMEKIENLVKEIITSSAANVKPEFVVKSTFSGGEKIGVCPRCKSDVCETPKAYSCNCGFALWKSNKFFESAKMPFTKEIASALVNDGKVALDGLYSQKTGKTYSAIVCLDDTGDKWVNFKLEFPKKSTKRR